MHIATASAALLALFTIGCQFGRSIADELHDDEYTFGVIVNCGSSGTRAHIYQWLTRLDYPELLHHIEPMTDENGKPITYDISEKGLSAVSPHPEDAVEYMKPLLEFISANIPKDRHSYTGVYIMATAGMRLLDESEQQEIMRLLKEYIENNYDFKIVSTDVISGADEGKYQWISLNSKAKRFLNKNIDPKKVKTFAVFEMGGASLQVTYQLSNAMYRSIAVDFPDKHLRELFKSQITEPSISRGEPGKEVVHKRFLHKKESEPDAEHFYRLYSTTFLGFGSNSIREALHDLLIREQLFSKFSKLRGTFKSSLKCLKPKTSDETESDHRYQLVVKDPCIPVGHSETIVRPEKILHKSSSKTIGFTPIEDDEKTVDIVIEGAGNYDKCRQAVIRVLNVAKTEKFNCESSEPCAMSLIGVPFIQFERLNIKAIGDFFYTTANSMIDLAGTYNHRAMRKKTEAICNTPYDRLAEKYPDANCSKDMTRLYTECFKAVWVDTFLTKALRMPRDYESLETAAKINGQGLDWTLGAVIDKSAAIERSEQRN